MNELLDWAGTLAMCMLAAAVLVAGWEHLAREAAAADRSNTRNARPPPHPGLHHTDTVDLRLEAPSGALIESNASHAAMAAVLTRAAARPPRDGSAWLDTCPQVTLGCADDEPASPAAAATEPHPVAPVAVPVPEATVAVAAAEPVPAPESVAGARPSTIERAALR